ncbi:MAG: hypothetical protein EB165_03805 [Euryarchaeota archaeon]|nr:hypothetical protein [Euryarchaeota archaeon]
MDGTIVDRNNRATRWKTKATPHLIVTIDLSGNLPSRPRKANIAPKSPVTKTTPRPPAMYPIPRPMQYQRECNNPSLPAEILQLSMALKTK